MSVSSIGASGLTSLEKAQMVSGFKQTQATSLVSGLQAADSAIGSNLLYDIYDQKALTPRILAATMAKSTASDDSTETEDSTSTNAKKTQSVTDGIIAANVSANSSAVPEKRPDYLVSGVSNVDLSA